MRSAPAFLFVLLASGAGARAPAPEWFVAPGAPGDGTSDRPFARVQDAVDVAQPGEIITVRPGTYAESLRTVRGGEPGNPITIRAAAGRGSAIVTYKGRVLSVQHPHFAVDGLVLDGQYGQADLVQVGPNGHGFRLRATEVHRSGRDAIDISAADGVLIEQSLIHHALNAGGGRTDAHGIVATGARDLTIRDTEIHTFSGDAIQIDPSRMAPGWTDVTIERCRLWLAPLPSAENGFPAGTVPGENAVDTKAAGRLPRARLVIRDTSAWGFRAGLITNMAAFNLKENVSVVVDGVTVSDSEIAFRLRGSGDAGADVGAHVTVKNAVVYNVGTAFRYEDGIEDLRIWNTTVGAGVQRALQRVSSPSSVPDVRNLLILGSLLPREAPEGSNLHVSAAAFVNATRHDYHLAQGSPAVDSGATLAEVRGDRDGVRRPQGKAYDVGAYERLVAGPRRGSRP